MKQKLPILFVVIFPVVFYIKILNGFFQQDEWYGFGWSVLHRNLGFWKMLAFFFAPTAGHYNPLTIATTQFLYSAWGMNYLKFAYVGIILHLLIIGAVYVLTKKIFRGDTLLAFLGASLFGVFACSYQGVSWVVADISTLAATLIGVISSILFLNFLQERKNYQLIWSLILLIVSLLFKEVTIGLFPLFFLIYLFYGKKGGLRKNDILELVGTPFVYLVVRIFLFFLPHAAGMGEGVAIASGGTLKTIYNFLTIPIKSVSQTIFPVNFLEIVSRSIAGLFPTRISGQLGSTDFDKFALERVMEAISLITGVFVVFVVSIFALIRKNANEKFLVFFALGWTILGSFIFSISPGTNDIVFAVDSRNLYFTSIGISFLVVYFCSLIAKKRRILTILILLPIFIFNVHFLNVSLTDFVQVGNLRKSVLNKIVSQYPKLSPNTVFYTESDSSYYGLPESTRIMPFQSGFGQTLLAWYENRNNFPHQFFEGSFLWPIDSEGYKEVNGNGFGYYRNFNDLATFLAEEKSNVPTLIAYNFDSQTNGLKNITNQIQGRIDGFESQKRLLDSSGFGMTSLFNSKDIFMAVDKNLKTSWVSQLPYSNYQYVIIDMKNNFNIAEVMIDSYKDQDQNGVGYRVELSSDEKNWNVVFESKRYPPNAEGKDSLYFEPGNARFVKIEQIGYHKYASWVISELSVYEKI